MKTQNFSKRVILALALCVTVFVAGAQAEPDQRSDRQRIQSVIIGKYVSEMDLLPEQSERFFPRLRQYQDRLEAIQRGERETRMELDRMSQSPEASRESLHGLIGQRRQLDQDASVLKQEFLGEISEFLTPQQVSRCSILLDDLPHKVRQFIREKEREKARAAQPQRKDTRGQQQPRRRGY